jgi:hypothetical protein
MRPLLQWKIMSVTYYECVFVALGIQDACSMLSSVGSPVLLHVSILSHKWHIFERKKVTEHKMCVWIFSRIFVASISHSVKK